MKEIDAKIGEFEVVQGNISYNFQSLEMAVLE